MENLQVFENVEFGKVRTVSKDGEVWFVAKDVAEVLQYSDARDAVSRHCRWVVKHHIPHPQSKDKTLEVSIIPERDVYRLVMRSKMPKAVEFEEWVVGEVLPTIKRTGGYVIENRAIDFVNNWLPSLDETSKNAIANVLEENRKLVLKIEQDKPLVEFAETISIASDSIDIGTFAKLIKDENIDLGRNRLFAWLRDNKYLMKDNEPYQKYINEKYFEVEEYPVNTPYGVKLCNKTSVTGLGQIKLVQKLKSEFGSKPTN